MQLINIPVIANGRPALRRNNVNWRAGSCTTLNSTSSHCSGKLNNSASTQRNKRTHRRRNAITPFSTPPLWRHSNNTLNWTLPMAAISYCEWKIDLLRKHIVLQWTRVNQPMLLIMAVMCWHREKTLLTEWEETLLLSPTTNKQTKPIDFYYCQFFFFKMLKVENQLENQIQYQFITVNQWIYQYEVRRHLAHHRAVDQCRRQASHHHRHHYHRRCQTLPYPLVPHSQSNPTSMQHIFFFPIKFIKRNKTNSNDQQQKQAKQSTWIQRDTRRAT